MTCGSKGKRASSSRDLWKIAPWNVRSLYQKGKLASVCNEIHDVLGTSETFWDGSGEFTYDLPSGERFKVVFRWRKAQKRSCFQHRRRKENH